MCNLLSRTGLGTKFAAPAALKKCATSSAAPGWAPNSPRLRRSRNAQPPQPQRAVTKSAAFGAQEMCSLVILREGVSEPGF